MIFLLYCKHCNKELSEPVKRCSFCNQKTDIPYNVLNAFKLEYLLLKRFEKLKSKNPDLPYDKLEELILEKLAVSVNMQPGFLLGLFSGSSHPNLHNLVLGKLKEIDDWYYPRRRAVDELLSGVDGENIIYGALNLGAIGLHSYGSVCVFLRSEDIQFKTSFIESNSYLYVDKKGNFRVPDGSRSLWNNVIKLILLKHNKEIKELGNNFDIQDIANIILLSNGDKNTDVYIEAHICQQIKAFNIEKMTFAPKYFKQKDLGIKQKLREYYEHEEEMLLHLKTATEMIKEDYKVILGHYAFYCQIPFEVIK